MDQFPTSFTISSNQPFSRQHAKARRQLILFCRAHGYPFETKDLKLVNDRRPDFVFWVEDQLFLVETDGRPISSRIISTIPRPITRTSSK